MRVSELTRQKPVNATIDLGDGDSITLTFDRNKVTPAWANAAQARDEADDTLSAPKALEDVLLGWDVVNDDGSEFPPSAGNIAVFSYPVQRDLLRRILEQAVPASAEGNASANTSSTPVTDSITLPVSPQNGLQPSPLPEPSASQSPT